MGAIEHRWQPTAGLVGLVLLEQIEKRERGLFTAIFYTIKIMIEQCDRGPRLGMGADVGCRTHLCIFLTEFEHRKAKFGEQFVGTATTIISASNSANSKRLAAIACASSTLPSMNRWKKPKSAPKTIPSSRSFISKTCWRIPSSKLWACAILRAIS